MTDKIAATDVINLIMKIVNFISEKIEALQTINRGQFT
jgi:hypothetical protein